MNVAALLQDAPSDDHRRRQELRDRDRDRDHREHTHARDRDRENEREREHQIGLAHRQQQPLPPHHPHPADHTPHLPGPSTFVSQFQVYDGPHRSRDPLSFQSGPAAGPASHAQPYVLDGRPPPPSTSSPHHPPPLFMSPLAGSASGPPPQGAAQPGEYLGDYIGARESLGRGPKHGPHGKPTQTVPLYPTPAGPMPEGTRSGSLSRPRSPYGGDFSGRSTPGMASHPQLHTSGPGSHGPPRSPRQSYSGTQQHREHLPPSHAGPVPSHKSPGTHQTIPTSSRRAGGMHGGAHVLESPAMGSLRPTDEQGFSAQGPPGSSSASPMMIPRDKDRHREEPVPKEKDRHRKVRPALPNGAPLNPQPAPAPAPAPATSSGLAPGFDDPAQRRIPHHPPRRSLVDSEHDRDRDRRPEWDRERLQDRRDRDRDNDRDRDDMNAIRAAASNRIQGQNPTQGSSHHHHHPLPHHHVHAHHGHSHPHPQHIHLHQAHPHPPKPNKPSGVLVLAPPGISSSATAVAANNVKTEVLPLAPAHIQQPPSPPLPLQLAPAPSYQQQQPPGSNGLGLPSKHGQKSFTPVPTGPGGPGAPPPIFSQPYTVTHAQPPHSHHPPPPPASHHIGNAHSSLQRHSNSPLPPLPPSQQPQFPHHYAGPSAHTPPPFVPLPQSPLLPALHLGTFVHPRTPFPYVFPTTPLLRSNDRETRATILIPSFLPDRRPDLNTTAIWGGGLLPLPSFAYNQNAGSREREREREAASRRVYTDDSDLLLCALHAGKISWQGLQIARKLSADLRVEVCIRKEGRYLGGLGVNASFGTGEADEGLLDILGDQAWETARFGGKLNGYNLSDDVSGLALQSASWGNGHDGSGMEVLRAVWIPRGSAQSLGLRNRTQRMSEYTERRQALMDPSALMFASSPILGKRGRTSIYDSSGNQVMTPGYEGEPLESERSAGRTVVFGFANNKNRAGFKYNASVLKSILFTPPPVPSAPPHDLRRRKRRKQNGATGDPNLDGDRELVDGGADALRRAVVLENDQESFLLTACMSQNDGEVNKENRAGGVRAGWRWDVFLVAPEPTGADTGPEAKTWNMEKAALNGCGAPLAKASSRDPDSIVNSTPICATVTADKVDQLKSKLDVAAECESKAGKDVGRNLPVADALAEESPSLMSALVKIPTPLHQNVGEDNIEFREGGVVIAPTFKGDTEAGWFLRVQRWSWAR